ncbi:MAG: hypothetical protein R3F07_01065 [Opitutaceae bacterium]
MTTTERICSVLALVLSVLQPLPLVAQKRPDPAVKASRKAGSGPSERARPEARRYTIEQAVSDRAQLHTIAFNGLAFMTGDFGSDTFIPPGKVSDFFGFQYMRDIDAAGKGHNPMFLNRVAGNVLQILNEDQRALFLEASWDQALQMETIARMRWPVILAFDQELRGQRPEGRGALDPGAVSDHFSRIYALDAELAFERARVFGAVARSLTESQRARLGDMQFGDFDSWPEVDREALQRQRPRGESKMVGVAYLTLASEFFSWQAGSIDADVYFCPERHGTTFGGFYLKDLPAMGQKDFDISTSLTGDSGEAFLDLLNPDQRARIESIIPRQRDALREIVSLRREIAGCLRGFLAGEPPDREVVLELGRHYGELDGFLSFHYATAFAEIFRTLDLDQQATMLRLRNLDTNEMGNVFIFSQRVELADPLATDPFFTPL